MFSKYVGQVLMIVAVLKLASLYLGFDAKIPVNVMVIFVLGACLLTSYQINQAYVKFKGKKDRTKYYLMMAAFLLVLILCVPSWFSNPSVAQQAGDVASILGFGGAIFVMGMEQENKGKPVPSNSRKGKR
ncbi:hypothetical protein [Tumebacillus flagellatus]|uniref:Uncharacterized protein n=1 Tax=Tumebacillus flagellatus TaxID=1157490 RepID=A0A074LGR7_9BACL|nr:hypothetical protein [Tumebacillus flagellatus]KEO81426.1 hypothetical protein EL26_21060 [Tumebacillus flagellatus]